MKARDFNTGTIAELAEPVSAEEVSASFARRNAAYSSDSRTEADQIGRLKQMQTHPGGKRAGGGWKKMTMTGRKQ